MKTNILVLITLFFTLSFATRSYAVEPVQHNPHCLETQNGYIKRVVFEILNFTGPPQYFLDLKLAGVVLASNIPVILNDPAYFSNYVVFDVSLNNIPYSSSDCYDYDVFDQNVVLQITSANGPSYGNLNPLFCNLECALPCDLFLETEDIYYSCGEDFPTICPINANASTQWTYNAGVAMAIVHTGDCFTPTQPGDYVLINSGDCYSTASFTIIDTCAPCNADFELQIFNQGNGMYGITPLLNDPSVSFVYIEILQNGVVVAQSSTPSSFALPGGSYTICIVVRNNWTGEVCQNCQDFCIGETTDFEWDGIERASVWERESENRSNNIQSEDKSEKFEEKQLEENMKPIIMPNPSNGSFVITSLNTVGMSAIEVYDMSSKLVYSINSIQDQNRINIDLTGQESGVYITKILYTDGSIRYQKVVVEK